MTSALDPAYDEIATLRGAMTAKEADYDRLRAENDALKLRVAVLEKTVSELGGRVAKMLTAGTEHRDRLVAISMGDPP